MRILILLLLSLQLCSQSLNITRNNLYPQAREWNFTKHPSNPLVAKNYLTSYYEYYPSALCMEGATFRCMAKNNNEGWGYSSADGVSWSEGGKYLSKGTGADWDNALSAPLCLRDEGDTLKLLYSGYDNVGDYDYMTGYAITTAFGTFTKTGTPYSSSDYNANNSGTDYPCITVTDVVKLGTTYYYFGVVFNNTFNDVTLCFGAGTPGGNFKDLKCDTKILSTTDIGLGSWLSYPNVFKHPVSGEWYMTVALGNLVQNTTTSNQSIYVIKSGRTDVPDFSSATFISNPILQPDITKGYENNYTYSSAWLKDGAGNLIPVDGSYRMYYAAHQAGAQYQYTGAMCLAIINSIP